MPTYLDLLPEDVLLIINEYVRIAHRDERRLLIPHRPRTNSQCIYNWMNGKPYKHPTCLIHYELCHWPSFHTDGGKLYSYALMIGHTDTDDEKVLHDYTAKGLGFKSQTTSCHVGLVRPHADTVLSCLL